MLTEVSPHIDSHCPRSSETHIQVCGRQPGRDAPTLSKKTGSQELDWPKVPRDELKDRLGSGPPNPPSHLVLEAPRIDARRVGEISNMTVNQLG